MSVSKYTTAHLIQVPSLDRSNRTFKGILSSQIIIRGTSNSSSDEHSGCPVEIPGSDLSGIGPEAPEECEGVKDTTIAEIRWSLEGPCSDPLSHRLRFWNQWITPHSAYWLLARESLGSSTLIIADGSKTA
jgi:hypothetical protein